MEKIMHCKTRPWNCSGLGKHARNTQENDVVNCCFVVFCDGNFPALRKKSVSDAGIPGRAFQCGMGA